MATHLIKVVVTLTQLAPVMGEELVSMQGLELYRGQKEK